MGKMQNLSGVRSLEGLRSLVGSTSTAMDATKPTAGVTSYGTFANLKMTAEQLTSQNDVAKANVSVMRIKLRRLTHEIKVLEGKLEQATNENAKLVKENKDLKVWQCSDSKIPSTETLCDQLTETLQQLASQTEQAEVDKKHFEDMLGKYSKALVEINLLLHDLSTELVDEKHGTISEILVKEQEFQASSKSNQELLHTKLRRKKMFILERKLQQAVKENADIKAKQTEIAKIWQGLDLKISSAKTISDQLTSLAERDSTAKHFSGSIDENKASWKYTALSSEPEMKEAKRTRRSFHSTSFMANSKKKRMPIDNAPGNNATIVLNAYNLKASRRSYRRGIKKARAWCRANDTPIDLSGSAGFEPGDEVYRTPEDGTFHLKFEYRERSITFFIAGKNLYLKGWETDRYGKFEMKADDLSTRFIQNLLCTVLKMSENYIHLAKNGLSEVSIGPIAMMNSFDVVHKSQHVSDALIDAVTVFAVNTSEAIRIECILEEISEAFTKFNITKLGKFLAFLVRNYGYYSRVYLKCIDHILNELDVPIIQNHPELEEMIKEHPELIEKFLPGKEIRSVHDLRRIIKVPLRTVYNHGKFTHDKDKMKKPAIWSPPYPDGKYWVWEEEDEVEEQKLQWSPYPDGSDWVCEEEKEVEDQQLEQEDENEEGHAEEEDENEEKQQKEEENEEEQQKEEENEEEQQKEYEDQGQEEDEEEEHVQREEKDVRDSQIEFYRKMDGMLKMTSNLSRFVEAASKGGASNVGNYGFFATVATCKASTSGHRLVLATSAGMMTAREVKSGRSIACSMFRYASKVTRILHRIL